MLAAERPGGSPVESDLGPLPFLARSSEGGRHWISQAGLKRYLRGETVLDNQVAPASRFYRDEPRVGIARDQATHAAREQMLYAPTFVRLADHADGRGRVGIGLGVDGIPDDLQRRCVGVRKLGGEGRMVAVGIYPAPRGLAPASRGAQYRLLLLSPARWGGDWLPPLAQRDGTGWTVTAAGIPLRLISAAVGKYERIGGWDILRRQPKPAEARVPAGSAYFVRPERPADLSALHGRKLGLGAGAGFGQAAVGRWLEGVTR